MADSATTSNRLRKQTLASNVNVWGDPYLNANFDLIDAAMDGVSTIAVGTATATTLTSTNYASDQTRNRVHVFTGTGTQTLTATIPFVTKNYLAINDAAGPVRYIMASGTGATVEAGRISWVVADGTNVRLGTPRLDQVPSPTSAVSLNSQRITGLAAGTAATDAASLSNRLDQFAAPTAAVSFGTQRITNLATPTGTSDAVTKAYADGLSFSAALPAGTSSGDVLIYNGSAGAWAGPATLPYLRTTGGTLTGALTMVSTATVTASGGANFVDTQLVRAEIRDYSLTLSTLGNAGGTATANLENGNAFSATSTATTTWVFSNPPSGARAGAFSLFLINGGQYTQTWPTAVRWNGNSAPTLTSTGTDELAFVTYNAGTNWHGRRAWASS